jgi:hypothetical protein
MLSIALSLHLNAFLNAWFFCANKSIIIWLLTYIYLLEQIANNGPILQKPMVQMYTSKQCQIDN